MIFDGKEYQKILSGLSFVFALFLYLTINIAYSQSSSRTTDTLIVDLFETRIGRTEITILKRDKDVYLPITDIFDFLRLKYDLNFEKNYIKGFIVSPDSNYEINFETNQAKYKNNIVDIRSFDYYKTKEKLFIHERIFRDLFRWNIKFDENRLEVVLKSKSPFPLIQQRQRQRSYRKQIERDIIVSDLYIGRKPLPLNLGKLNYNINSYKLQNKDIYTRYNFLLGGQFLWGDFEGSIRGTLNKKIKERDIQGSLKYPFFDNRYLQQITLGDIYKRSFVGGNLFGIDITNIPPERRSIFSPYIIKSNVNSNSEYYLTGRGIPPVYTFAERDTSIETPMTLFFGYNEITERIYDWYGQQQTRTSYMIIPYTMIPPGEFDYRLSGGVLRQKNYPVYSSADLKYGATQHITLGAGVEYLNRENLKDKIFPYTYATVRLYNNLYGNAEFSPFVLGRVNLNWQTFDQKIFNIRASLHNKNKILNPRNITNSYGASFHYPFTTNIFTNYFNANFDQNILEKGNEQFLRAGIGSIFKGFSIGYSFSRYTSSTTYTIRELFYNEETEEEEYRDIDKTFKTKYIESLLNFSTNPTVFSNIFAGARFDHVANRLKTSQIGITISFISSLAINLIAEKNFITNDIFAFLNLTFNPSYISAAISMIKGNFGNTYSASIRGEVIGSTQTFDLLFNRITQRKRGYLLNSAFIDLNKNGIRDKGEQYLKDIRISGQLKNGFGVPYSRKYSDYSYLISGELYRDYILKIRTYDLEDPLLVPLYEGITVKAEPNKLKRIEIPIVTGGIISGVVVDETGNPAGGVTIKLSKAGKIRKITVTNSQGEFEFPTVPPGIYQVFVDEETLKAFNLISEPAKQELEITGKPEEGYVSTSFVLKTK